MSEQTVSEQATDQQSAGQQSADHAAPQPATEAGTTAQGADGGPGQDTARSEQDVPAAEDPGTAAGTAQVSGTAEAPADDPGAETPATGDPSSEPATAEIPIAEAPDTEAQVAAVQVAAVQVAEAPTTGTPVETPAAADAEDPAAAAPSPAAASAEVPAAATPAVDTSAAEAPASRPPAAEAPVAEPATAEPAVAERPSTPAPPAPPSPARPRPGPPRRGPRRPSAPSQRDAVPAAAAAAVPHVSPVPAASAHPERWGRVDAEGTIFVRTADGERTVGSWQAGAPEEGLAHFARRFDDLLTEVELLAARLTAGGGDPKQTLGAAKVLRDGVDEATVVGDLVGLRARLDDIVAQAEAALGAARSARDAQRAGSVARKEELAAEAETLATEATQWKQAGDRFTAILDEWRTIRGIDRKTDELLWKRFSKAREAFNRRRGSHFADLDRQRAGAKAHKEELVVEAEKLADSDDWGPTAARFRDLMTEWKAAGRAQKDTDDVLWQRFRSAQDAFFARRSSTFAERDAEFVANAEAKKALLTEAEKIDLSDPSGARAALRSVQERWEAIGKVPRDDIRTLEARLRAVEEKVRESADRQWQRTDPEAEARVSQFRDRVAQFEAQAAKAAAAGDRRRAEQAEAQANQWREWLTTAEQAVQHR